ncbi:exosortase N [Fibrella sp. HMF5405]|uniref:Exosortase N n=2 Tax=Fibrella forsythiae TaxID=2817061 RepID=A0ABS3JQQ7_9BACT|nr:exosortase N [Fibrella forsythiae]MBO0952340.1 exosortase N [Fibrella forsythiae]
MPDLLILLTMALIGFASMPGQPGRHRWLTRLVALLALSPLLRYVDGVFGFAVRLRLSAWAGLLLRQVGIPVQVDGNILLLYGQEMAVDPACMGLRMTGITLLLALFWLLAYERRWVRSLPLGWVLAHGGVALGLTMVANLLRIILLVLFRLLPDNPLHEAVGLMCILAYAWLPIWVLARWLVGRYGTVTFNESGQTLVLRSCVGTLGIAALCLAASRPTTQLYSTDQRAGYVRQTIQLGFVQYSRPGELIYVKPLPDWYSAEHSPTVCWKGQGYTLCHLREVTMNGRRVYTGQLKKGRHTLNTAWWFTNGLHQSIGQLDVRLRMLRGEPGFALLNVTVATPGELAVAVKRWQ